MFSHKDIPADHPLIPNTIEVLENFADGNNEYSILILKHREELKPHLDFLIKRGLYETIFNNDDLIKLEKRNRFYRKLRDE